jgi:ABC-2 type transport system permease protein
MNTETAELQSAAVPAAARTHGGTRATLVTLLRREFWEHPALWRVPLIVASLLTLTTVFSVRLGINVNDTHLSEVDASARVMLLNVSQELWAILIYLVAGIVITLYVLDCLYAERKDRSILFWKSLPVSDGLTVLAKFLVAAVVVPLGVFVLATASHLLALAIWKLRVAAGGAPDVIAWDTLAWLRGELVIFLCLILSSLWYAPLIAAAILLSAWAKRSPLLWATLPLVLLPIFEYIVFRTGYIWSFIRYREYGIWYVLTTRNGRPIIDEHARLLNDLNWSAAFTNVNLWLGVLAAAALLYAAARIRRYRDDT